MEGPKMWIWLRHYTWLVMAFHNVSVVVPITKCVSVNSLAYVWYQWTILWLNSATDGLHAFQQWWARVLFFNPFFLLIMVYLYYVVRRMWFCFLQSFTQRMLYKVFFLQLKETHTCFVRISIGLWDSMLRNC